MSEERNTWGTDEEKTPEPLKPGPEKQTRVINWCRAQIVKIMSMMGKDRIVAGRNVTIDQTPKGRVIHAQPPQYAVPFHVIPDAQSGATGVRVGAGYLADRSQTNAITPTNLRTFLPLSAAGYVYLEITINAGAVDSAAVVASTSAWAEYPVAFRFTSDPAAYDGTGAPPTQTRAFVMLARYYGTAPTDGAQLRQFVTTHLEMRWTTFYGLPALRALPGVGLLTV